MRTRCCCAGLDFAIIDRPKTSLIVDEPTPPIISGDAAGVAADPAGPRRRWN